MALERKRRPWSLEIEFWVTCYHGYKMNWLALEVTSFQGHLSRQGWWWCGMMDKVLELKTLATSLSSYVNSVFLIWKMGVSSTHPWRIGCSSGCMWLSFLKYNMPLPGMGLIVPLEQASHICFSFIIICTTWRFSCVFLYWSISTEHVAYWSFFLSPDFYVWFFNRCNPSFLFL